ncbi:MAG: hypothetical protein JRJ26_02025 [Deltaproteobacteria bacterium]|nr:hypothetical protein [Deltaproteobacteria bacterium]
MTKTGDPFYEGSSILKVSYWYKKSLVVPRFNLVLLEKKIRFHLVDISSAWKKVEEQSDRVVTSILSTFDFFERSPDAMEDFGRLLGDYYSRKGVELDKMGRSEEAKAAMLTSISCFLNQADVHRNLAVILARQGELERAVRYIRGALQIDPRKEEYWSLLIALLNRCGLDSEGIDWMRKMEGVIPPDPGLLRALGALGLTYHQEDMIAIVLGLIEKIEPEDAMIGPLKSALEGDLSEAVRQYEALPTKPGSRSIPRDLSTAGCERPFSNQEMLKTLRCLLPEGRRRIALYTAGGATRSLLERTSFAGFEIVCIIDRDRSGGTLNGYPIVTLSTALEQGVDYIIVSSPAFYSEIKPKLQARGLREFNDFSPLPPHSS